MVSVDGLSSKSTEEMEASRRQGTLPTKVRIVKATVSPVVMYGCESWTLRKAESWRIDAFRLWCRRRLLRVSRTARISNQSVLKEINAEYSLEGLMLKLKFQYSGHLMGRANSVEKDPDAGKNWRQEEKEMTEHKMVGWHHWLNGHEWSKLWETVKDRKAWCPAVHGAAKSQIWLSSWTTIRRQVSHLETASPKPPCSWSSFHCNRSFATLTKGKLLCFCS